MIPHPAGYVTGMRIHHLNCATLCPPARSLVNGEGGWHEAARLICHCLLVETADALVLVDTGLGQAEVRDPGRRLGGLIQALLRPRLDPAETAIAQVRALGFKPEDVRHVVVTHLDVDHAGGLGDFPWAQVHVSEAEHSAAMNPATWYEAHRYRTAQWAHEPAWVRHAPGGEAWMGFEGVQALLPGEPDVLLVPLTGHTRGHCGIAVRTAEGWLVHAGDAYYHHAEMEARPACPPAMDLFQRLGQMDQAARLANQARLRALACAGEVRVVCSHDPVEFDRCALLSRPARPVA